MGRYYEEENGMFDGKFWFAVQSSDALSTIGFSENEPSYAYYTLSGKDDIQTLKTFMNDVRKDHLLLPADINILQYDYQPLYNYADSMQGIKDDREKDIANYELALKCITALLEIGSDDSITIQCEI